ncbi:MAG: regulatory iron-sulfur-containing complex subunit RicT [candidate division Zixibacteria bacterium]|nr:regulatory iron-sulfur-containing complex subunit RicT [candidate division Zixibacteria bacterium]
MAELYLVEFKGSRKEYYLNTYYHSLGSGNLVVVQAERGEDIGVVLKKFGTQLDFANRERPRSILRRASEEDKSALQDIRSQEKVYESEIMELITRHGLDMNIIDVDYQFDGNKMTVYFTASRRVDFRELVKDLAARYRTRIELRQIGVRDEARRLGGFGICGRPQCCNSFIREFEPISTQHAREQGLPLNPTKISGNCGRLLCCLKYEAGFYASCKRKFPEVGTFVRTKTGDGRLERIDVFKEEAVIRGKESQIFRCPADQILASNVRSSDRTHETDKRTDDDDIDVEDIEDSKESDDASDTE